MKLKFLSPFLFFIAVFCAYGQERLSWPLDEGWRYSLGDDMARAEESHDDSGWSLLSVPGRIELDGAGQYFWLRATVGIPAGYRGETLWFETGKAGCAFDVYADGIYIGSRGSLPPRYFTRMQQNLALLVPASLTGDGSVVLALRCYYNGSEAFLPGFALGTADHAEFVNYLQNLFNMRVYIILSVICLFLGSYFIAQFISRPDDRASIYYALSLIFIAFYFYDMGTERLFLDGLVQRAIGRASLTASLGFLMLFLMKFFEAPGIRIVRWVVAADIGLFTFAFLVNIGDDSAINMIFNLSLLPVFMVIIYGLVIVMRAARRRQRDSWPILIGLVVGVGFGVHDIAYQVLGRDPFAWLQGFTFFSLNLSVFIAMSSRSARAQKELDAYMKTTSEQRDTLSQLVSSAEKLAADTSTIAKSLDGAVAGVAESAARSAHEARAIGDSVEKQNGSLGAATEAVEGLVVSLRAVNEELELEAASIAKAAADTSELITGFESVGEGIEGAASFAQGLDELSSRGRRDMDLLAAAMARVKESSGEILGVVEAVNDFAEKTNLLAMNASIEAAHAGAAGRGFAVIAQEIKKLAAASAERAGRIGEIASGIDRAVGEGFDLSVRVKDSLVKVAAEASGTASRVREAAQGMARQRSAGAGIAAESESLAASAARIRGEASRQYSFSEKVSATMAELASVAEDVGAAAADIVSRNADLSGQAEALKDLARRSREAAEGLAALMAR